MATSSGVTGALRWYAAWKIRGIADHFVGRGRRLGAESNPQIRVVGQRPGEAGDGRGDALIAAHHGLDRLVLRPDQVG